MRPRKTDCLQIPLAAALLTEEAKRLPVGGQAVIEGVLMKGSDLWGLAVRRPDGSIFQESWRNSSRVKRYPWKAPLLRGVVVMCEMMATGFRALSRSAEIALEETQEKLTAKDILFAIVMAVVAVAGLFVALPLWIADWGTRLLSLSPLGANVLEGAVRATVFVGYVGLIGLWSDIRRVFCYHGAEHKTINAFESDREMTPEAVAQCSRIHPRCGTSFLLIAVVVSIAVFSAIGGGGFLWRAGTRVLLIPLVIGVSYEIIRLTSNAGWLGRLFMAPVLSLQYLTTREPDLAQIEVALTSLNVALGQEPAQDLGPALRPSLQAERSVTQWTSNPS